ncbi:hypothetical protein PsorP6_007288 [Peronosclerospora sorghi]|uniref:Uncharacterized protein n=1 Tax=Peronosclerospora sorghi TaxID=230839 RepID=A0ACC0WA42_9STRA|nr:hypothetical protein PsorP6_007288 [Peronosclerospora sorghi]
MGLSLRRTAHNPDGMVTGHMVKKGTLPADHRKVCAYPPTIALTDPRPAGYRKVRAFPRRSYHNICPTTHPPFYPCTVAAASHYTLLIAMENLPADFYPFLEKEEQAAKHS